MLTENFFFPGTDNSRLSARIYSNNPDNNDGIIFSHGLFSSMDGYKITRLAEDIVSCGYNLMTFNFSSAENLHDNKRNISVLKQVRELGHAVDEFRRRGIKRVHLMGSSMGAATTLLYASASISPIKSLILIATPLDLPAIIPGMTDEIALGLDENGYSEISGLLVNNGFFKEIFRISMIDAVQRIYSPVLLIHGENDEVVNFSNFRLFLAKCRAECMQVAIENGDHNLTGDSCLQVIRESITKWLRKFHV